MTKIKFWTQGNDAVNHGVEVRQLDTIDHGVEVPATAQRGDYVASDEVQGSTP